MIYKYRMKVERKNDEEALRPVIPIVLSYGNKSKQVNAILDTGSDMVYLPKEIADYFELPLHGKTFSGASISSDFEYKLSKINIKLEHAHKSWNQLITTTVPLTEYHNDIILGTDFLQNFIVTFDYPKRTIKLNEVVDK